MRNKGGRPVGSRNAPKPKTWDYTQTTLRDFQKPVDFYAYLAGYPDKTALLISVYRLKPVIDHSLIGIDQSAILQTPDEMLVTEDAIGDTFGRGKYMLKLNDSNRPKGQQRCCRTWIEMTDCEKPPQYDPRTLCLGEAQNQNEITRLLNAGMLVRDGQTGAPRLKGENDQAAAAPLVGVPVPSHNGHSNNGGGELFPRDVMATFLLGLVKDRGNNPHDTVKDVIDMARTLQPPPAAPVDLEAVVERVVSRLQVSVKTNGRELDAFANYERMEGFIQKVRGPVAVAAAVAGDGAVSAASPASWMPHLPAVFAEARLFLPELVAAFRNLRSETAVQPAAAGAQNGGQQRMMTFEEALEDVVKLGFRRMREGVNGFDFAAWLCNHHPAGLDVYRFLEPGGTVGLIGLAAMKPEGRLLVNDPAVRPQLEAFLDSFFTFDAGSAEEAALPSPPAAGLPAGASK